MEGLFILLGVLLVLAMPVSIVVLLVGQSRLKARMVSVEARLAQQMVAVPAMAAKVEVPFEPQITAHTSR